MWSDNDREWQVDSTRNKGWGRAEVLNGRDRKPGNDNEGKEYIHKGMGEKEK